MDGANGCCLLVVLGLCLGGMHCWAWYRFSRARTAIQKSDYFTADRPWPSAGRSGPPAIRLLSFPSGSLRYLSHFKEAETLLRQYRGLHGELSDRMQLEWYLLRAQMGDLEDVVPFLIECVKKEHRDSALILETLSACISRKATILPCAISSITS